MSAQAQVTVDSLIHRIGQKDVQIMALEGQVQQLQQYIQEKDQTEQTEQTKKKPAGE